MAPKTEAPEVSPEVSPQSQPNGTVTLTPAELEAIVSNLVAKQLAAAATAPGADANWIQQLTREIGKLTTQGTGQPEPIEPHVLERRKAAKERMITLINDMLDRCVAAGRGNDEHAPLYRVLQEVHMDGRLIAPFAVSDDPREPKIPTDVFCYGIPNVCLFPLNEVAEQIHEQFMIWAGDRKIFGHDPNERYFISRGNGDGIAMRLRESIVVSGVRNGVKPIGLSRVDGNRPEAIGVAAMSPEESKKDAKAIAEYMRRNGLKVQRDENAKQETVLGTYLRPAQYTDISDKAADRRFDGEGRQDMKTYG